jgi:hypothetical protein
LFADAVVVVAAIVVAVVGVGAGAAAGGRRLLPVMRTVPLVLNSAT